jgi:O-antigen ligase
MERIAETVNKYLLYLITSYVLIDYGLRHTGYSMLASLWDEILFIIIVGLWVIWAAIKGIRPIASNLLLPLLLFYAVLVFNFLTRSPEPQIALTELRALVEYTFWFFIALNLVSTRQQVKNLLDIFLLVGVLVALYGIYQYATGAEIPPHWIDRAETGITTRAFSFIGSPNVLGSFLILNINIAFASFLETFDLLPLPTDLPAMEAAVFQMLEDVQIQQRIINKTHQLRIKAEQTARIALSLIRKQGLA